MNIELLDFDIEKAYNDSGADKTAYSLYENGFSHGAHWMQGKLSARKKEEEKQSVNQQLEDSVFLLRGLCLYGQKEGTEMKTATVVREVSTVIAKLESIIACVAWD